MAHTGIFATSAQCKFKAGDGVSVNASSEANINSLCIEIEGFVNALTRTDFSTRFTTIGNPKVTGLLTEIESNYCGYFMIAYDNSGYNSIREAENLMNTCWARFIQCIGRLKSQDTVTFINNG